MEVKYRHTRAELEGSKFGLFIARLFGVRPKLVKHELSEEEAIQTGIATNEPPKLELPPGHNNGDT